MMEKSAEIYDAIYSFKNYKNEAHLISNYILKLKPDATTVLDVACGTGRHIEFLKDHFIIDGIDLNEAYIRSAKIRNNASSFWIANMTSFHLDKKYDVVMCMFSSIAYVKTLDLVRHTVDRFIDHLHEGGIILIEPWFTPNDWKTGFVSVVNSEYEDTKVCRMSHADRDGDISILNFEYLVGSAKGITHYRERHELGLFDHAELLNVFESTRMKVEYDPEGITGRGLYILS